MAKNGEFTLFWMPEAEFAPTPPNPANTNWTENLIPSTNKVEIEADTARTTDAPDALTGLVSFKPSVDRTNTKNSAPFTDEAKRPDTGFSGIMLEANIIFDQSTFDSHGVLNRAKAVRRLLYWYAHRNTVRGIYREGRLGLRNNYRPEFNLVPTYDSGWKLIHFDLFQDLKFNAVQTGQIILGHSGNPRRLAGVVEEAGVQA